MCYKFEIQLRTEDRRESDVRIFLIKRKKFILFLLITHLGTFLLIKENTYGFLSLFSFLKLIVSFLEVNWTNAEKDRFLLPIANHASLDKARDDFFDP